MLTFISLWNMRNRTLVSLILLSLLTACGKSGGGSDGKPPAEGGPVDVTAPVVIMDPDAIFSGIGITSVEELKIKLESVGLINVIAQITSENPDVQAEKVVRLLHQNNRNLEYEKVVKKEVPVAVVEKLKHLRMSPVSVEKMVKLPDFSLLPKQDVSVQALEIYNGLKRQELNRKLNLRGQNALSVEEFTQLQGAFSQVEIVDNFGNTDIQLQNLIRKTPLGQSTAQSVGKTVGHSVDQKSKVQAVGDQPVGLNTPTLPDGYYYQNPSNEEQEYSLDSEYPFTQSSCYIQADFNEYPRAISKQTEELDDGFVSHDSGNALIHFPQSGIAVIRIDQDMTLNISKVDGSSLVNQSVTAGQYVYLPVQKTDICDAYTFAGVSNSYDINLLAMVVPERLYTRVFLSNKQYLTPSIETELINHNNFFNPASYTFASFDSALTEFEFLFSSDSSAAFDILVYAPSGKVYSSSSNSFANRTEGHSGYYGLAGFADESIAREAGIWRFDLLPAGSIDVSNQQLQTLEPVSMPGSSQQQNKDTLTLTSLVSTDKEINHKEFVLGTVKTISFNTEGEDGHRNPGEVNVTLNTVMAPPLDVPDTLQHLIDENSGKLEDRVALWQCWEKSEKTGFELEPGNACNAFRGPYDTMQESFEDAVYYRNHEYDEYGARWFRLTEPCTQLQYEQGHATEGFMCEKGLGEPYDYLPEGAAPDDHKVRYVLNYHAKLMRSIYSGESFLYTLSRHYDLYTNWVSRAVQVSTSTYPNNRINYKTYEYIYCNPGIPCEPASSYSPTFHNAAILESNKPIFGVPVERMVESTAPITFDYAASDEDEYNDDAALFAVLEYVAVQTFNLVNGNFIGMICDSVGLVDDLHQLELDAEADPLGSARMSINRYSSSDPFYGLHHQRNLEFYMSGVPEENTKIDTHGQRIKYAQLACDLSGFAASGTNFAANADTLLNLDYGKLSSLEDMTSAIQAMAILENSANMADNAEEIATHIRNGDFDAAKRLLKIDNNVNALVSGTDMYSSTDVLLDSYINDGSAANGNNVVKSHVQYLKGGEKKTRANLNFERVTSIPAQRIKVTLNTVKIIANKEDKNNSDDAEIIFEPYVGEVNDSDYNSHPYEPHGVMDTWSNNGEGIANLAYSKVKDGQTLSPETVIYNNYYDRNAAALYIELAILEDDGNSVESDDMVGVFSQTIKLEELFNQGQFSWIHLGGRDYQLVINEFPVYNDKNQRVLENPLDANYEQQKYHNRHRSPSALVTLTVDVTLNDSTSDYPAVYTGLNPSPADEGKDTYSMEMSVVNSLPILDLENPQVFDVLDGQVIVTKGISQGLEGTFYSYDHDTMAMTELFSYNMDDFSGDLLPIKNALYSLKSIAPKVDYPRKRVLPLFKLLPNNHLLFVISTDDGAKIMIVSYNNQGQMTLVKSHDIKQIDDASIYTLLNAKLSPNREGLLIPYVPESYKGGDKSEVVHPRLAYYTLQPIDGSYNVHYHSTLIEPAETIQEVDFIGDNSIAVKSIDVRYVSEDTHIWKSWFTDFEKNFQRDCSSELLSCFYGYYGGTLSIYNIVKTQPSAHALLLTESIDLPYYVTTYPNGDPDLEYRSYSALGQHLFSYNKRVIKLQTVGVTDTRALLRLGGAFYQLHFDDRISSYTYTGKSVFGGRKDVKFNSVGQYYCAEGIVCSGYLKQAVKPSRDDTGSYTSELSIHDFKFADMERDLLAGITYDFEQSPAQAKLSLLSLYNGTAYKGPHVSSDVFETEVVSNGANHVAGFPFTFSVTDRDTRIDQLTVDVIATTTSTTKEPARIGGHIYEANCTVDEAASSASGSNVGNCSGTVLANFYNADLTQRIDIVVSDGVYTTTKSFTLNVERELPVLTDVSRTVIVQNQDSYFSVGLNIDSQSASMNVSSCTNTGTSYCHLLHNGYVDNWVVSNKPEWLTYSNVEKSHGHQALSIAGTPPMGAAGSYELQVFAVQNTKAGAVRTPMTVTIIVEEPDIIGDNFSFISQGDIEKSTLVESNVITVTGINGYSNLSINSTAAGAEYWRSSTGAWSNEPATDVVNGEQIKLHLMSSDEYDSSSYVEITLAGVTATFTVNTEADPDAPDSIPDFFSFTAVENQDRTSLVPSNEVILSGFNQSVSMTVSNGEYSLNNTTWTTQAATVESGQSVWVRHTTAADYDTQVTTSLTVGGVSANFTSTTSAAPAPMLSAGGGYIEATINQSFSFIPTNTGGAAINWSITDKPEWAAFNEVTGELSGVVTGTDEFTINITATNSSGSDTFTTSVYVALLESPYINGYSTSCSIDSDQCDYSFIDNSAWRSAITQVSIQEEYGGGAVQVLTSPTDYEISDGQIRLLINATNNMVKQGGDWQITVEATDYNDSQIRVMIDKGVATVGNVTHVPLFEVGVTTTVSAQITNRFGMPVSSGELDVGLVIADNNIALNEMYRYSGGGSGDVWRPFNDDITQNTFYSDDSGDISFQVRLPGCIDINDGFTLSVGNEDIIYNNSGGDCIDVEGTNRYIYGIKFSEVDTQGNVYTVFENETPLDDAYTNLGRTDFYVVKQDRNGEQLWVKQIGTDQYEHVNAIAIDNGHLFLAGSSFGDLDINDSATEGGFLLSMNDSGDVSWIYQESESSIDSLIIADNKLHYSIKLPNDLGNQIVQRDLNGSNPVIKVQSSDYGSAEQLQTDSAGNYYVLYKTRRYQNIGESTVWFNEALASKFDSSGLLVARSIAFPYDTDTSSIYLTLSPDSIFVSMTADIAIGGNGFDDEVLNADAHTAVRVAALRLEDLSTKWTKLIQSEDVYGQGSIASGLAISGDVLYTVVSTEGELYYDPALISTPNASLNLIALHAGDGSELAHKSWITDRSTQKALDEAIVQGFHLSQGKGIGSDNVYLTGKVTHRFNETPQMRYYTRAPYSAATESFVLKTKLSATAPSLPPEPLGLSRNAYTERVTDYAHGIQWDDHWSDSTGNYGTYWEYADSGCTNLWDQFGDANWRLPTETELGRTGYLPVPGSVFEYVDPLDEDVYYWSSTEGGSNDWHIAMRLDGSGDSFSDTSGNYYRCVRDMN